MESAPIFNPNGNDNRNNRQIWYGNSTNLIQLNDCRYQWAVGLYRQMRENFWIPQKFPLTEDVTDYANLTVRERRGFDGILSYLTFLDSIQTCNIPHLKMAVTAPEVDICLAEQTSQEAMHNESYSYMIESLIPEDRQNDIYEFWRQDKMLYERCKAIAKLYQQYVDNPTEENYFIALLADYILEGIYFYNGFAFFLSLAYRQVMAQTADIIRLIQRDELNHVRLFQQLLKVGMETFPYSTDLVYSMFDEAVKNEIQWTNHIIGDDVSGINNDTTERYTKYLANQRLKAIGLDGLYPDAKKNPYKHLETFADTQAEGATKANFFEAQPTGYNQSSALEGWDF